MEFIVQNEKDAIAAKEMGSSRVELVSAIQLGGLTPSYGTIKKVVEAVEIPVQIMIRPHSYSFIYNKQDKEVMKEDIALLYNLGHYRIVIGALDEHKKIDTDFLNDIFKEFPNLDVTFHRAFDEVEEQIEAYQELVTYRNNIKRILTSGGEDNCVAGMESLRKLVKLQHELKGPVIMPGSGVTLDNIKKLHKDVQAEEYHFGSGIRKHQDFEQGFDKEAIRLIQSVLSNE